MDYPYLTSTKNLGQFLHTIKNAQAPGKFTTKFLEDLGFKSTNDRLLISLIKSLGSLDSNAAPTESYFRFLDDTQSKLVLGESIRKTYSELFMLNTRANELSLSEIKSKFKTITQGKKTDDVLSRMSNTFKLLCEQADFTTTEVIKKVEEPKKQEKKPSNYFEPNGYSASDLAPLVSKKITTQMHYNIQIHLPETRDVAVYDAIFESLKKHLL